MNDLENMMERWRQQRIEDERREKRDVLGCAGATSILILLILSIIFIGCPAAVSYGVSRGCAAGAEHAR